MEIVFLAPENRSDKKEILDNVQCDIPTLQVSLRDIAKFNSLLKTNDAVLFYIKKIIKEKNLSGKIKILDLCTGSADIPIHIINWSRVNNKNIEIIAIDIDKDIIEVAKQETKNYPEIICQTEDAFNLNYEEKHFNIVICSQAFHHFSNDDCIKILKVMDKLSNDGIIVNDLRRAWINYIGAFLISRLLNMEYMTKNDAPISVLRAFTKKEFINLAEKANIKDIRCYSFFTHSLQLVCLK